MSYAVEVIADETGEWIGNGVRLPVKEEAEAYSQDLYCRWVHVRKVRVVTSEDPANYHFENGRLVAIENVTVRRIKQSDIRRCPHIILVAEHYRDDGTCRCDDPDHTEMAEWGYTWDGQVWVS